jgi:hypothetical protein
VPVRVAELRVAARIGASEISFSHDGQMVARTGSCMPGSVPARNSINLELLNLKAGRARPVAAAAPSA